MWSKEEEKMERKRGGKQTIYPKGTEKRRIYRKKHKQDRRRKNTVRIDEQRDC